MFEPSLCRANMSEDLMVFPTEGELRLALARNDMDDNFAHTTD